MSSLACNVLCRHMLRYIFCPLWHCLFKICWDPFWILAGMGGVLSTKVEMHFVSSLSWEGFGQCYDPIIVLDCIGKDWSTRVEIHVVSSLTRNGFGQHLLRGILCPRWHERVGQLMLRNILCPRWYGRGFANTCLDKFCGLAGMGWVWWTHVEINFVSSPTWETFGQHKLRCTLSYGGVSQHKLRYIWDLVRMGGVWSI